MAVIVLMRVFIQLWKMSYKDLFDEAKVVIIAVYVITAIIFNDE